MEKAEIKVMYDKDEDMLSLFKEGRKAKFSHDMNLPDGNLIVDFSSDGLVAGLEFLNASNYFPSLKKANGNQIKAKMSVKYGENAIYIYYVILIPGQAPMSKEMIISPYSKELIVEN